MGDIIKPEELQDFVRRYNEEQDCLEDFRREQREKSIQFLSERDENFGVFLRSTNKQSIISENIKDKEDAFRNFYLQCVLNRYSEKGLKVPKRLWKEILKKTLTVRNKKYRKAKKWFWENTKKAREEYLKNDPELAERLK